MAYENLIYPESNTATVNNEEYENIPVNLGLVQSLKKEDFTTSVTKYYTITFYFNENRSVVWRFTDIAVRDSHYDQITTENAD